MWIKRDSEEWKMIPYHAGILKRPDIEMLENAVFGKAARLSSSVIASRCEELGRNGTFHREKMRLAMQISQGYDNGVADRWRGSHRVGQYMDPIQYVRFMDEKKIPEGKRPTAIRPGADPIYAEWRGSHAKYGDIIWRRYKKIWELQGVAYDRQKVVWLDKHGMPEIAPTIWGIVPSYKGLQSLRDTGPDIRVFHANATSTKLADAYMTNDHACVRKLLKHNDITTMPPATHMRKTKIEKF